jgi:nucleotide-binding universal stress UspA family protein
MRFFGCPTPKGSRMKVLLAVDGSTSSDRAASLVANLAWPMGSTIDVVTVYPGTAAVFDMPGVVLAADVIQETEDAMEAEARRIVVKVARRVAAPDLTVQTQVLRGRAATALLHEVSQFKADLVVVGNRGRGPFESAVLGSVSAEIVDHGGVPVLVARRDHISRILLGEDGSKSAAAAADTVRRWSALHGSPIRVLSVADVDPQWNPWLRGAEMRAAHAARAASTHEHQEALSRSTAAALEKAGLVAEGTVEDGNPAHRLVEAAASWDADLMVVGAHGHSGLGPIVGSVARAVLYHAPCSILVVPEPPASPGGHRG